jgi:hypothetical protein
MLTVFPFLKGLLGTGHLRVFGAYWAKDGGYSSCRSSLFYFLTDKGQKGLEAILKWCTIYKEDSKK